MKRYFLDTSALVKIYHREAGSDFCLKIYTGQAHLIISELAKVELSCEKEQDGFVCADKKLSAIVEHENVQVVQV